jgi:hypothetical protein
MLRMTFMTSCWVGCGVTATSLPLPPSKVSEMLTKNGCNDDHDGDEDDSDEKEERDDRIIMVWFVRWMDGWLAGWM